MNYKEIERQIYYKTFLLNLLLFQDNIIFLPILEKIIKEIKYQNRIDIINNAFPFYLKK